MTDKERNSDNQWDQVDDFKWLKAGQSPHWSTLSEDLRLGEDVWTKIVPGQPGASVGETLAKVGLPRK
jgi:tubulin-specific chaperone C